MVLPSSNSLKVVELVEKELEKNLWRLYGKCLEANNYKTRKPYKNSHQYILLLIMSYHCMLLSCHVRVSE